MAEERVQRRLSAILVADVVGYSRLIEADEEGTRSRLRALFGEIVKPRVAAAAGRVVKSSGDGLLVEFTSAVEAVRSALEIQAATRRRATNDPDAAPIEFRIGINVGDVIVEDDDIHGDGVNVAARLEGLCTPGNVFVSGTIFDQAAGKLAATFEDLGERTVKNISKPIRVYRVSETAESVPSVDASPTGPAEKPSIAVLPFDNLSGDPEQEYFSDGICEDIITALSRIRYLFVAARNSSFSYKGQQFDIRQVAEELGVRYVLEGSVRKAGNRLRITAQLIDGTTGNHLWAERYDHSLEDVFDVQDQITATVVGTLQPELGKAERDRARAKRTEDLDAWDAFQRGMWHTYRRDRQDLLLAVEYFDKSIAIEPSFAPAHWGKAICYFYTVNFGRDPDREAVEQKALEAARKSISLDPDDSMAHTALAYVNLARRDPAAVRRSCETAIELDPNNYMAHRILGISLVGGGKAADGLVHLQDSLRLSPRDPLASGTQTWTAMAYLFLGKLEMALDWSRRAMRNRQAPQTWVLTSPIAILGHLGRADEAKEVLAELNEFHAGVTCTFVRDNIPISDADCMDTYIDGLRKAGLPE